MYFQQPLNQDVNIVHIGVLKYLLSFESFLLVLCLASSNRMYTKCKTKFLHLNVSFFLFLMCWNPIEMKNVAIVRCLVVSFFSSAFINKRDSVLVLFLAGIHLSKMWFRFHRGSNRGFQVRDLCFWNRTLKVNTCLLLCQLSVYWIFFQRDLLVDQFSTRLLRLLYLPCLCCFH